MSEVGSMSLTTYPSFQLDRARFEADLLRMNAEAGVDVHIGARAHDLTLHEQAAPSPSGLHEFSVTENGQTHRVRAKWLVDASGRASLVARQKDLRVQTPEHGIAAAWGRFIKHADMDDWARPSGASACATPPASSRPCTSVTPATGSGSSRSAAA
jgi:flavin-dependent dehydrogenase